MTNGFSTLGIRQEANNYLREMGIAEPTPIQTKAIPALMAGKDLIAQSQTGTGKTLAFLLPIMENIVPDKPYVQALIITPTRELALQITKVAKSLGDKLGVTVVTIYGGHNLEKQINQLKGTPHVVVGTPGRLLDHFRRKTLSLARVTKLVLDEADQMLDMGFLDDVEEIVRHTAAKRQTMLFSATIPPAVRRLAAQYMVSPADIRVQTRNITLDEIDQVIVETTREKKLDKLCGMINEYRPYLAMVFCHTKQHAISLNIALSQRGYAVDELHGDLSQTKREQVMKRFREAKLQILVVTDIAARGLDIEGVTHIFNYDIPRNAESYIHRIGRTGRAGQRGMAVTFVAPGEHNFLRIIEQGIGASIKNHSTKAVKNTGDKRDIDDTVSPKKPQAGSGVPPKRTAKDASSHSGINLRSRRKPKNDKAALDYGAKDKRSKRRRP